MSINQTKAFTQALCENPLAPDRQPIEIVMDCLINNIMAAEEALGALRDRLAPVTNENPSTTGPRNLPLPPGNAPLTGLIHDRAQRIGDLCDNLRDLRSALEL